jgi:hypothetical protein
MDIDDIKPLQPKLLLVHRVFEYGRGGVEAKE